MAVEPTTPRPLLPSNLLRVDQSSLPVTDADEEVFDLYSNLSQTRGADDGPSKEAGLGFVDIARDTMEIDLELRRPEASEVDSLTSPKLKDPRGHRLKKPEVSKEKTVSITIHQDIGALRNRKGDTGSVIWRASLFLCEHLLQQYYLPMNTIPSLIDFPKAKQASVLELGAGTGLCSVLLNELFGAWIATDQYDNLRLIQRNLRENKLEDRVRVKEVDWFQSLQRRNRREEQEVYDLVLAVDCIYNEALIKPLIATFDRYATCDKTLVWVVIELRSSDVVSAFLEEWLSLENWHIYRLGNVDMRPKMSKGFVGWVGWKNNDLLA